MYVSQAVPSDQILTRNLNHIKQENKLHELSSQRKHEKLTSMKTVFDVKASEIDELMQKMKHIENEMLKLGNTNKVQEDKISQLEEIIRQQAVNKTSKGE